MGRLRRRDRNNAEVETKSMQEQLSSVHQSSTSVAKCVEHLSSVIWMLLQSERASSALDLQDDSDRAKVALIGYRDNSKQIGEMGHGGSGERSGSRGAGQKTSSGQKASKTQGGNSASGPVVSVDHRCLSCSGQAQSVLSGFKMACLQYAPGPVTFAKKNFVRSDLLDVREKLLDQARDALQHGPIAFSEKDPFDTKEALSLSTPRNGGVVLDDRAKDENLERGSSRSSNASNSNASSVAKMPPLSARR